MDTNQNDNSNSNATNNTFTFTWKIENITFCSHGHNEKLWSPFFKVMMLNGSLWSVCLYPRGYEDEKYMSCYLYRIDGIPQTLNIEFTLCIIAKDGRQHFIKLLQHNFRGESDLKGISKFFSRSEVMKEAENWLPNGTLTVQCKIWKKLTDVIFLNLVENTDIFPANFLESTKKLTDQECFILENKMEQDFKDTTTEYSAFTKIPVSTFSFYFWGMLTERCVVPISSPNGTPCLLPTMSIRSWGSDKCYILLRIQNLTEKSCYAVCKLDLLNTTGDVLYTIEKYNFFKVTNLFWNIRIKPNFDKAFFSQTIKIKVEIKMSLGMDFTDFGESRSNSTGTNTFVPDDDFKYDILALYRNQQNCDLTIVSADGKEFYAHRLILSARAPFFAFIDKENRVEITDVDSEILHLLLEYIYSSELVDLESEVAKRLYLAADKFQLLKLKEHCGVLLKYQFSTKDVCDVLQMAERQNDRSLKMAVIEFISQHAAEVFSTYQWQSVIKKHELADLVTEVFSYMSQMEIQSRLERDRKRVQEIKAEKKAQIVKVKVNPFGLKAKLAKKGML